MAWLRSVLGLVLGACVSAVLFQIGAAIALVVLYGMPLGMSATPGAGYFALNFAFSAVAGVAGGWVAARIAMRRPIAHAVVLALAIAALTAWGFSRPPSHWPPWYGPVLAVLGAVTVIGGGVLRRMKA